MKIPRIISDLGLTVPLTALLIASNVGLGLVGLRVAVTGNWRQLYLVGNLFLAWLPLVFSLIVCRLHQQGGWRNWRFFASAFAWLVFFPNAPYIFTDLIHLHAWPRGQFWVDLVLILLFAWTAFLLGFVSLYLVQSVVIRLLGKVAGWLLIPLMAGLSALEVCMGRFLRWNSWDILLHPLGIFRDLAERAVNSLSNPQAFVLPCLFAIFLLMAYLTLYALTHLPSAVRPVSNE